LSMTSVEVYTDGSGTTGGPAGVGYVVVTDGAAVDEGSLPLPDATNYQAEVLAAVFALDEIDPCEQVKVWSDSEYLVKNWVRLPGWIERGWRTASRSPVKNQPHWTQLMEAVSRHGAVTFEWLRGHDGNEWNERADVLAGEARMRAIAERDRLDGGSSGGAS
jgi:ribonuclease HI